MGRERTKTKGEGRRTRNLLFSSQTTKTDGRSCLSIDLGERGEGMRGGNKGMREEGGGGDIRR
jgi:hypothetical protein